MMDTGRSAAALAASSEVSDSLAVFAGSPQQVATMCEGNVEATISAATLGGQQLPLDFNSEDYLNGCTAAGHDMLKPGAK